MDLPTAQTVTSHALLTLPDTLTELDLLLPPDPTILSQALSSGRDTTLLSNTFDLSVEYPRGVRDEDDPLSQFPLGDEEVLDFALDDGRSFSVERGRDAMSVGLEDEFGSIKGLEGEELDFGFGKGDTSGGFAEEMMVLVGDLVIWDLILDSVMNHQWEGILWMMVSPGKTRCVDFRFRGCFVTTTRE